MPLLAVLFGALLAAVGAVGYFDPQQIGNGEPHSPTALIPAYFGAALILCGLIVLGVPSARKHVMHFAAIVGLFGTASGLVPGIMGGFHLEKASVRCGLLMTILCLLFLILCINSFIQARKARKASGE